MIRDFLLFVGKKYNGYLYNLRQKNTLERCLVVPKDFIQREFKELLHSLM